jgi:hypothetical protein
MDDADLGRIEATLAALQAGREERDRHLQPGQCPGCGSYRLDGLPPLLHEHGCQWKADAPLWYWPDGTPMPR